MKKRLMIAIILACVLILAGCGAKQLAETTQEIDKSTKIVTRTYGSMQGNYSTNELQYILDEKLYTVHFDPDLQPALDWLHSNSKPSEKVLTWWDNGHMVRGYARREPIIYSPSREILDTVATGKWDEGKLGPFSSTDDATNVAYAFLADSPTITQGIMKRYGAKWVFVAREDQKKITGMVALLGEDINNYLDDLGEPKDEARQKVLFKMTDGWSVKGFNLRYQDQHAFVYELTG